jgi:hypothetical protein
MRLWIMVFITAAGLSAQIESAPAADKLEAFKRNLANALRPRGQAQPTVVIKGAPPPPKVCSVPLLVVGPDRAFRSNMPLIPPNSKAAYTAEVVTPAPVCDEQTRK